MVIRLDKNYNAMTSTALLGYVGETNARPVSVEGMEIDGADRYVLSIDYGDGTVYEVDITDGTWTPTADILRSAQTVSCQIAAKKLSGDEYVLVKKSRIFRLRIGAAIGDTAIPSPSVAADALDRIDTIGRQVHADMQTAVTAAETATTAAENAEKSATDAEKSADTAEQAASRAETAKTAAETAAQTAQAVADSLPDDYVTAVGKIAENTAEIGRVKLTDKELTRRVNALYSIGNGITHQFETDSETAYQKTVPTGAKLMSVKSVGGHSEVIDGEIVSAGVIEVAVGDTAYPIPEPIRNLPGYGWSAGTAKNWVDYENKKYYQCVDSVDLGTLTWMKTSSQSSVGDYFYAPVSAIGFKRLGAFGITVHNILCSKYITVARNPNAFVDKTIVLDGDSIAVSQIQVKDTAYTDATAFKQAMSGVMLYYELANPIVTDISSLIPDDFLRNIEVEAGGSVTFKNSNDSYRIPVPNEEEYIVKLSEVGGTT